MIKCYLHSVLLAMLLVPLASCDSLIYDELEDCEYSEVPSEVHLRVNVITPQFRSGLRSGESINIDVTHYEDAVRNLAMLIFNSSTGQKVGTYFNDHIGSATPATFAFSVKMTPGNYDFYFVANMPNMQADLNGISDRAAMDTYLNNATRNLTEALYTGATDSEALPMARVYKNQMVTEGGTIYQPKPFKPQIATEDVDKVVAMNGTESREWVELIRAVAKLEVEILENEKTFGVDKIYFRNANRHFSLNTFQTSPTTYYSDQTTQKELKKDTKTGKYYFYMPEAIISTTPAPTWIDTSDNKPINYFTVTTTIGHIFNIPIISYNSSIDFNGNYLSKATGKERGYTPNYDIYRNHKYVFKLRNAQQIEILYQVTPWDLVEASTYMGYGYRVDIKSDGTLTITNTFDDCIPNKIILVAKNGAHFGTQATETQKTYGFSEESDSGYSKDKTKAGYSESFKIDLNGVASGQIYLEIYWNKTPDSSVTPDKTFTKK